MSWDRKNVILGIAVAGSAIVLCNGSAIAEVPRYKVFETTVANTKSYGNKFIDVELEAEFTSPSGATMSWRGFYDGDGSGGGDCRTGSVWRLRFMPNELGTWNYAYTWTDGTPGGSGSFDCVANGAGKGVIRAYRDNPRWFAYQGTEPVFLKSYQLYYEGLLHHDIDWTVRHVYQKMVDAGYNHLQIHLLPTSWYEPKTWKFSDAPATVSHDHLFTGAHPSSTMNLLVCHNLDKHMAWLNDHNVGLLAHQGFDGHAKGPRFHNLSSAEQDFYVKYICARLAPYANICGWNYTWETRGNGPELIWADLIMKYDPWSHLRSYHDRWPDSGPKGDAGHHFSDSRYSLANIENHIQDYSHPRSHDPSTHHQVTLSAYVKKPVFMSEGNGLWRWFWGAKEGEIHRNAWAVTTAGGSFCWSDHTEGGNSTTIFSWPDVKNRIDYLSDIMTKDVRFYMMDPHDELLGSITSGTTCYCLAEIGEQYIVYKEEGGTFDLDLAAGKYTATWIDTRTNERRSGGDVAGTGGKVSFSPPDSNTEWLLLLLNRRQPADDSAVRH
jgi:hypothetical protein